MRELSLALAGGALCLMLGASDGYAGAIKTGCKVPPAPGAGTPNSCQVEVPSGTQQVDPPGNIFGPDATFITGTAIDYSTGAGNAAGTSFSAFLGSPGFSNPQLGNQSIANSVIEFDGTFVATGQDIFTINSNSGATFVQLFVDDINVVLTPALGSFFVAGEPFPAGTLVGEDPTPLTPRTTYDYVLDFYTSDSPDAISIVAQVNGQPFIDSIAGGTSDAGGTTPESVPEPASLSLFAAGLVALSTLRRRRRSR